MKVKNFAKAIKENEEKNGDIKGVGTSVLELAKDVIIVGVLAIGSFVLASGVKDGSKKGAFDFCKIGRRLKNTKNNISETYQELNDEDIDIDDNEEEDED